MKKLAIPFLLSATLAACASNKDPVSGPMAVAKANAAKAAAADAAGGATPSAKPGAPGNPTPVSSAACPTVNGVYGKKNSDGSVLSINIATKLTGAVYSYAFDANGKDFTPADGVARQVTDSEGQKGTTTMSCDKTTITAIEQPEGNAAFTIKYTVQNDTQLQIDATGDAASLAGLYIKQ